MKGKSLLLALCPVAFCSVVLSSCGDEVQEVCPQGFYGTYVTSQKRVAETGDVCCEVVVIDKASFTTYSTSAVRDDAHWGDDTEQVPGFTGWYVERSSAESHCYVKLEDRILVENGIYFSLSGKRLTRGATVYLKVN